MQMPASSKNPVRAHRRAVWFKIIAPVVLPFVLLLALCVALIIGVATGELENRHIATMMSVLATVFIALPLTLLCLVPYMLLAVLAVAGGRGYAHAKTPLRFVRHASEQIAIKTNQVAPRLAEPLTGLNVRITRWEHTVRSWQQESAQSGVKERDDDQRK